jgi:hypothetical protein
MPNAAVAALWAPGTIPAVSGDHFDGHVDDDSKHKAKKHPKAKLKL